MTNSVFRCRGLLAVLLAGTVGIGSASANSTMGSGGPYPKDSYIENRGQWSGEATHLGVFPGVDVWLTRTGVTYEFQRTTGNRQSVRDQFNLENDADPVFTTEGHVVKLEFLGATPGTPANYDQRAGNLTFISRAQTLGTAGYGTVLMSGIYPGVSAAFFSDRGLPRYDLVIAPNADPSQIRMRLVGADAVRVAPDGALEFDTSLGTIRQERLFAYQGENRTPVAVRFVALGGNTFGFQLGVYDPSKPLVIDPVIFSSFLAGTTTTVRGVARDTTGRPVFGGLTNSKSFPTTPGAFRTTRKGFDGFLSKFSADGQTLIWSTFLGGAGRDSVSRVRVDNKNRVYAAGETNSADFPVSASAVQTTLGGSRDGFVTQLNADGSAMLASTYLGGTGNDAALGLDLVGNNGSVAVVGTTRSNNYPVTGGAFQGALNGKSDGFATVLNTGFTGRVYSTYYGGSKLDQLSDVYAFGDGSIIFGGGTSSTNFPTVNAFQGTFGGFTDGVFGRLNSSGHPAYSSYLGGDSDDLVTSVAVQGGKPILVGVTGSPNFPVTPTAMKPVIDEIDGFATVLNSAGTALVGSTFLGGTNDDGAMGVALDKANRVLVIGTTGSGDIAVTEDAPQSEFGGAQDAFMYLLPQNMTALSFGTYWGGTELDLGLAIASDGVNGFFFGGDTDSNNFPLVAPFQPAFGGEFTGTIGRMSIEGLLSFSIEPNRVTGGEQTTGYAFLTFDPGPGGVTAELIVDSPFVDAPSSVHFLEGSSSQSFWIFTKPVENVTNVPFTLRFNGVDKMATLRIDPPGPVAVTTNKNTYGDEQGTGTVTLSGKAPAGGLKVNLSSNNALLTVPASVTVPENATSVGFTFTVGQVPSGQDATITASAKGKTASRTVTLNTTLINILVNPMQFIGGDVDVTVMGKARVRRPAKAGGDVIALNSSHPAILSVPATVTIPEGATEVDFMIGHSETFTTTTVTITGTFQGVNRNVKPVVTPGILVDFTIDPSTVKGGSSTLVQGIVTINGPAPTGGTVVALQSADTAKAEVPATVTIPAGSVSAAFTITHKAQHDNTSVDISAKSGGVTMVKTLNILAPVLTSLTLNRDNVVGGSATAVTGTVTLDGPAPAGGAVVSLSSSDTAAATVPATVTVPAGATSVNFTVTHRVVDRIVNVVITASYKGVNKTANLQVRPR